MNVESVSLLDIATSTQTATGDIGKVCKLIEFDNYNTYRSIYSKYVLRVFTHFNLNYVNTNILISLSCNDIVNTKLYKLSEGEYFELFLAQDGNKIVLYAKTNAQYAKIYCQIVYGDAQYAQLFTDSPFNLVYADIANKILPIAYAERRSSMSFSTLSLFADTNAAYTTYSRTIGGIVYAYDIYTGSDNSLNIAYRNLLTDALGNNDNTKISLYQNTIKFLCPSGGSVVPVSDGGTNLGGSSNKWKDLYLSNSTVFLPKASYPSSPVDGMTIVNSNTGHISVYHNGGWHSSTAKNYKKSQTANPSVTIDTYGTPATSTPPTGYGGIFPQAIDIVFGGTFGSETVTAKITVTYEDATTANITKTATATGTTSFNNSDIMTLIKDDHYITQVSCQSQSTIASSAATVTFNGFGIYL